MEGSIQCVFGLVEDSCIYLSEHQRMQFRLSLRGRLIWTEHLVFVGPMNRLE